MTLIVSCIISGICLMLVLAVSSSVYSSTFAMPSLSQGEPLVALPAEAAPGPQEPNIVIPGLPVLQPDGTQVTDGSDGGGDSNDPEGWRRQLSDAVEALKATSTDAVDAEPEEVAQLMADLQGLLQEVLESPRDGAATVVSPEFLGKLTLPELEAGGEAESDLGNLARVMAQLQESVIDVAEDAGLDVETEEVELGGSIAQLARAARVLQLEARGLPEAFTEDALTAAVANLGGMQLESLSAGIEGELDEETLIQLNEQLKHGEALEGLREQIGDEQFERVRQAIADQVAALEED